jgi:hypothetical protein
MKLKLNPYQKAAGLLGIYSLGALGYNYSTEVLLHLAATLGFGVALFYVLSTATKQKKDINTTIISSLILFLILHYGTDTADLLYPLIATFFAIAGKFFIKVKGGPIFNPVVGAVIGLFLVSRLLGWEDPFVSWWGANFGGIVSLALMAVWIIYVLKLFKRYTVLITFLAVHAIILLVSGESELFNFTFTDASIYFLGGVMLIEPKTSPIKRKDQFTYGLLAAVSYNLLLTNAVPYLGIFAIAIANTFNLLNRFKPKGKKTVIKV